MIRTNKLKLRKDYHHSAMDEWKILVFLTIKYVILPRDIFLRHK